MPVMVRWIARRRPLGFTCFSEVAWSRLAVWAPSAETRLQGIDPPQLRQRLSVDVRIQQSVRRVHLAEHEVADDQTRIGVQLAVPAGFGRP